MDAVFMHNGVNVLGVRWRICFFGREGVFNYVNRMQYVGTTGSRFEATMEDFVPMAGWRFEIREKDASTRKRFEADGLQGSPTTITYNIQNKGFGAISNPASQNIIQIENLS